MYGQQNIKFWFLTFQEAGLVSSSMVRTSFDIPIPHFISPWIHWPLNLIQQLCLEKMGTDTHWHGISYTNWILSKISNGLFLSEESLKVPLNVLVATVNILMMLPELHAVQLFRYPSTIMYICRCLFFKKQPCYPVVQEKEAIFFHRMYVNYNSNGSYISR
jgi:hypothetical protein